MEVSGCTACLLQGVLSVAPESTGGEQERGSEGREEATKTETGGDRQSGSGDGHKLRED